MCPPWTSYLRLPLLSRGRADSEHHNQPVFKVPDKSLALHFRLHSESLGNSSRNSQSRSRSHLAIANDTPRRRLNNIYVYICATYRIAQNWLPFGHSRSWILPTFAYLCVRHSLASTEFLSRMSSQKCVAHHSQPIKQTGRRDWSRRKSTRSHSLGCTTRKPYASRYSVNFDELVFLERASQPFAADLRQQFHSHYPPYACTDYLLPSLFTSPRAPTKKHFCARQDARHSILFRRIFCLDAVTEKKRKIACNLKVQESEVTRADP